MRRRTNAGLTALQAALSGIGGGFAGYAKDTETRKADAERERLQRESERLQREREEERTYGREMGLAGLLQQGFTTPEQLATRRAAAGPDVANYVSQSVRSMMPGSTAAPPDPTLMQRVLDTAGGDFREGQRLTIGGRELVLPESTPQRQDRLAALARGEARNAAQVAAQQRAEDKQFQLQRDELQRKADRELKLIGVSQTGGSGTGSQRRSGEVSKTQLATQLPSVIEASGSLNAKNANGQYTFDEKFKKLRPAVMDLIAQTGKTEGALFGIPTGPIARMGIAKIFKPTEEELKYVQMANAIADAIARATDVGVLSDFDINRFRTQVTPTALDINNEESSQFKLNILRGWATWLANNKKTLEEADLAYEAGKPLPNEALRWIGTPPSVDGVGSVIGQQERRGAGAPATATTRQPLGDFWTPRSR